MVLHPSSRARRAGPVVAQLLLGIFAPLTLAAAPARTGTYLLVPIGPLAASRLAAVAIGGGAAILARGPLPASLIVSGDRARLFGPLLAHGTLTLAGYPAGCGTAGI